MSGVLMGCLAGSTGAGSVSIADQSISKIGAGITSASYSLQSGGNTVDQDDSVLETWLLSGAAADYGVYVTKTGDSVTGSLGSWLALSSTRTWGVTAVLSPETKFATLTVQIRNATTLVVLDTATVTLSAERI